MVSMPAPKIKLYVPDMWRTELNKLAKVKPEFKKIIKFEKLDEYKTGVNKSAIDRVQKKSDIEDDLLHILLLPITHFAIHKKDCDLRMIGPAISTKNDIFLFRNKVLPVKRRFITSKSQYFSVGVKESELTTTNAVRLLLANWTPDYFLRSQPESLAEVNSEIPEYVAKIKKHFLGMFNFREFTCPKERLNQLLLRNIDAAIFMGKELNYKNGNGEKRSLFQNPEIIDVLNVNRELNNIYNTQFFPRAVFSVFSKDVVNKASQMKEFVELINETVAQRHDSFFGKNGSRLSEANIQIPSYTGWKSDGDTVVTLIKFIADINRDEVISHRGKMQEDSGNIIGDAESISIQDFVYWGQVFWKEMMKLSKQYLAKFYAEKESNASYFKECKLVQGIIKESDCYWQKLDMHELVNRTSDDSVTRDTILHEALSFALKALNKRVASQDEYWRVS